MQWFADVTLVLYWLTVLLAAGFLAFVVACVVVGILLGATNAATKVAHDASTKKWAAKRREERPVPPGEAFKKGRHNDDP